MKFDQEKSEMVRRIDKLKPPYVFFNWILSGRKVVQENSAASLALIAARSVFYLASMLKMSSVICQIVPFFRVCVPVLWIFICVVKT